VDVVFVVVVDCAEVTVVVVLPSLFGWFAVDPLVAFDEVVALAEVSLDCVAVVLF